MIKPKILGQNVIRSYFAIAFYQADNVNVLRAGPTVLGEFPTTIFNVS